MEIDKIMEATNSNPELFKYLLFHFTASYEQSNIMGYDKIFVHMVNTFFRDKEYDWLTKSMYDNMIDRVDKIIPLLIGKTAPELILIDSTERFRSLYEINKDLTIIIFWTTTCSECNKEIKHLQELYADTLYNLEVFAVNTDTNLRNWKNYIKKNNLSWINVNGTHSISKDYHILYDIYKTPSIYILDDKFKILAKQLMSDQIDGFLQRTYSTPEKQEK